MTQGRNRYRYRMDKIYVGFLMSREEPHDSTLPIVTEEVRAFYDRYPYPRPIESLEKYRQLWQD